MRHMICKYVLPFCELSFYFLDGVEEKFLASSVLSDEGLRDYNTRGWGGVGGWCVCVLTVNSKESPPAHGGRA